MNTDMIPLFLDDEPKLSREQKIFNSRIKKLKKRSEELEKLLTLKNQVRQSYYELLEPKRVLFHDLRESIILVLAEWVEGKKPEKPKKTERDKTIEVIVDAAYQLITEEDRQHLITLHDRYADVSHEEKFRQANIRRREHLKEMYFEECGMEMDFSSIEDMFDFGEIFEKMNKLRNEHERERQEKGSPITKKEAKKKQDESAISKLCKNIYNKLVKSYHPDLEIDDKLKDEKTDIMKQLTTAYRSSDILTLLKLSFHMRSAAINKEEGEPQGEMDFMQGVCPESQLRHLNKLLLEQIRLKDSDIAAVLSFPPLPGFQWARYMEHKHRARSAILEDSLEVEAICMALKQDLERIEREYYYVKKFVRSYLQEKAAHERSEALFSGLGCVNFDS